MWILLWDHSSWQEFKFLKHETHVARGVVESCTSASYRYRLTSRFTKLTVMLWIDHVQVLQGSSQLHHVQVAISMIASCPINDIRSNLRVSQWSARRSLSICLLLPLCTTEVPRCQTATHETFFQWYRPYWIMLIICLCSKVNIFILGSRHWACMYMHMYMIRLWFQILFVFYLLQLWTAHSLAVQSRAFVDATFIL